MIKICKNNFLILYVEPGKHYKQGKDFSLIDILEQFILKEMKNWFKNNTS